MRNLSSPRSGLTLAILLVLGSQFLYAADVDDEDEYVNSEAGRLVKEIKRLEATRQHRNLDMSRANAFLDDDQMLDPAVAALIKRSYDKRTKRKAVDRESLPDLIWPSREIEYKYDDEFGAQTEAALSVRQTIQEAIKEYEAHTCLRFREIRNSPPRSHVIFQAGASCVSYLGKSDKIPQPIYLDQFCRYRKGEIIHYIGQTIGLWHEHQRQDREDYVQVNLENVLTGEEGSFAVVPPPYLNTHGLPYDYSSVMHFHSTYKSVSDAFTVVTRDPLYQKVIGQRVGLSFYDIKVINHMYDCMKRWCSSPLSCQNDGYQDPNDCSNCKCPDGFGGQLCDQLQPSSAGCGGELTAEREENFLTSPDYEQAEYYDVGTTCVWKIQSPNGEKIRMKFAGDFGLHCFNRACYQWVEIKYNNSRSLPGPRFCCYDLPTDELESGTDEVLVIFNSQYQGAPVADRRGFKLGYSLVPSSDTTPDPCDGIVCNNEGTCEEGRCQCLPGFTGSTCESGKRLTTTTPYMGKCSEQPCGNQSTCEELATGFRCLCAPGYTGALCESDIDECASNPCVQGKCIDLVNGYRCECFPRYTGETCESYIPFCQDQCQNGATCLELENDYKCQCLPGYVGDHCEVDFDECDITPCKNGGSCIDLINEYKCLCKPGYGGKNCQNDIDECASRPCKNKGNCTDSVNDYQCTCPEGYDGKNCENDINECQKDSTCLNGGTCVNFPGTYRCICPPQHTGNNCEIRTSDPCDNRPCKNGGTCRARGQSFVCSCRQQFSGDFCQDSVPAYPCRENPCRNRGVCIARGNSYYCQCPEGLSGTHCELGTCGGCEGSPGNLYPTCRVYDDPPRYITKLKKVTAWTGILWWRKKVYRYTTEMVRQVAEFCCDVAETVRLDAIGEKRCGMRGWSDWSTCEPAGVECCKQESHRFAFANFITHTGSYERRFGICETKERYCDTRTRGCNMWHRGCDECRPCD